MSRADQLDYLRRARGYRTLDARLWRQTRFFGAAALLCEVFAALSASPARYAVSAAARRFLAALSADLERVNLRIAAGLVDHPRTLRIPLDARMVRIEQHYVQRRLEGLGDRKAAGQLILHCNRLLNSSRQGCGREAGASAAARFAAVLDALRRREARDLDFARRSDREAIGVGLIEQVRAERLGATD
jgi:hypothetical protein